MLNSNSLSFLSSNNVRLRRRKASQRWDCPNDITHQREPKFISANPFDGRGQHCCFHINKDLNIGTATNNRESGGKKMIFSNGPNSFSFNDIDLSRSMLADCCMRRRRGRGTIAAVW
jgi:hypothetical protein